MACRGARTQMQEVISRWQAGRSRRQIAAGASRAGHRAQVPGLDSKRGHCLGGTGPRLDTTVPFGWDQPFGATAIRHPGQDLREPAGDQIYLGLSQDKLQMTRVRELLVNHACPVSYP